ncbi:hypothetical protein K432DRAFT_215353 [Lepidopterella palustris CBS 459.81]|uniref:Methyltransferase domain-containing protein n=1 Tax=Lepidopterella palustris CBS 459.81 TaxID=1314670 RepID=A0A8E2J974_9PEZI|nr:hypothetical protein K432DRAFT_215353 [Lepidopterella palustris CBS 459.81]
MAYQTPAAARATYNAFAGQYNVMAHYLDPERDFFLTIVEQVLHTLRNSSRTDIHTADFGTGNGVIAVKTKKLGTGNGVTVGVDVAAQVLRLDGKHLVSRAGFNTAASAPLAQRVCLIGADATDPETYNYLRRALPEGTQHFDLITAFSFADTIPFNLRPQTWQNWFDLLTPVHGRLVVTLNLELQEDDGVYQNNLLGTVAGVSIYDLHGNAGFRQVACPPLPGQTQDRIVRVANRMQYTRHAPESLFARCRQYVQQLVQGFGFTVVSLTNLGDHDISGGTIEFVDTVATCVNDIRPKWTRAGPVPDWFIAAGLREQHKRNEPVARQFLNQRLEPTPVSVIAVLRR